MSVNCLSALTKIYIYGGFSNSHRGFAGFTARDMAPLFAQTIDLENVILPKEVGQRPKKSRGVASAWG